MSFNFLIQATRVLDNENLKEDELDMVYVYVISLDNDILNDYNNTCTILSYDNDLELYVEIIDALIKIYEEKEEYEKCNLLIGKKGDAKSIIENKNI